MYCLQTVDSQAYLLISLLERDRAHLTPTSFCQSWSLSPPHPLCQLLSTFNEPTSPTLRNLLIIFPLSQRKKKIIIINHISSHPDHYRKYNNLVLVITAGIRFMLLERFCETYLQRSRNAHWKYTLKVTEKCK